MLSFDFKGRKVYPGMIYRNFLCPNFLGTGDIYHVLDDFL